MNNTWRWIIGIVVGLAVAGLLLFGASERQAYRIARGAIEERDDARQARIDAAVESATALVDNALVLAGDLPSQQAQADLIKQDIEEIGNRLKEASEDRSEASIDKLNAAIDQFNATLETIDEASKNAESEVAKAKLDRLYGYLDAAGEALAQAVVNTQE